MRTTSVQLRLRALSPDRDKKVGEERKCGGGVRRRDSYVKQVIITLSRENSLTLRIIPALHRLLHERVHAC